MSSIDHKMVTLPKSALLVLAVCAQSDLIESKCYCSQYKGLRKSHTCFQCDLRQAYSIANQAGDLHLDDPPKPQGKEIA